MYVKNIHKCIEKKIKKKIFADMPKIHIGKKIKEVWKKSRLKGTEFASLINRDRQVIYDIFKRESIDTELLQQISKVLNHDFFGYYNSGQHLIKESKEKYGFVTQNDLSEVINSLQNLTSAVEKIQTHIYKKPTTKRKNYKKRV